IVFHAGSPESATKAACEKGRCSACIWLVVSSGRSPANALWNADFFMYKSVPVPPPGSGYGRWSSVAGPLGARVHRHELGEGLTLVGSEGSDVDERLHVRDADGRVGDHRAAIGVANENDRTGDRLQDAMDVFGVGGKPTQRVCRCDHRKATTFEVRDFLVPSGRVRPATVHEHDRRLGTGYVVVVRRRRDPGHADAEPQG